MNAKGSHRSSEEGESHGVPHKELGSQATTNPFHGDSLKRETPVHVSQTWGTYGSYKAHIPHSFRCFQEEPELGEKEVWSRDEEYIKKIKRPLLNTNVVPEDDQSNDVCQKVVEPEKTHRCGRWTRWLW
jgi:hypothetical protein